MKKATLSFFVTATSVLAVCLFLTNCSKAPDAEPRGSEEDYFLGDVNANVADSSGGSSSTDYSGEGYNEIEENPFVLVEEEDVSTFSVDADGGSYANVRRFLNNADLPVKDAVRTEELINYFSYDYPGPEDQHPIALNGEISTCPWNTGHKLLRVGIQGKDVPDQLLSKTNFVFLIDVSGSMSADNKLPLLKQSFNLFVEQQLGAQDRVAIVTYSGSAGVVLPSTSGDQTSAITWAINNLDAGGSTAGAEGIITAYEIAEQNFIPGGNNRVILATDGDFNVGISSQEALVELIEEKRESGVFLTVIGVGAGNLQDGRMEQIANNGNGTYEYIDNLEQGEKVFIHEFKKFYTVAKDVKIQIQFNPDQVKAYRLIGYENRLLEQPDFEDDEKDAGEIGANQSITALYELIPVAGSPNNDAAISVDFRYKLPDEDSSIPLTLNVSDQLSVFQQASEHMRFAASVAAYGMLLRDSEYKGTATYDKVLEWASNATSYDPGNYRAGFLELVAIAEGL